MKITKRVILLVLATSLFLVGCGDDSGFSIAKPDDSVQQESTMGDDLKGEQTNDNSAHSGATGSNEDQNQENQPVDSSQTSIGGGSEQGETSTVDLGNQIQTFVFTFVKSDEEKYANVSFEDDPFDKKYDFAYYTVNDQKLEKPEYRYKEIIDGVETYKIYLGSNESGTYVLKFFNSSDKQYGRVNVNIKFKSSNDSTLYFSVAFNLVQIKAVSLAFSIQTTFKKIGDFFSNLFTADRISL